MLRGCVIFLPLLFWNAAPETLEVGDESLYSDVVGRSSHVLVEFYEEDCRQCERVESEFFAAAAALEFVDDIQLVRVNTQKAPALKEKFGVVSHPVFKWFPKETTEAENFYLVHYGGRMAETLLHMISEKVGRDLSQWLEDEDEENRVVSCGSVDSFRQVLRSATAPLFVNFLFPWTEPKKTADILDQVAKLGRRNLGVVKFPVEKANDRDFAASDFNCTQYPCYFLVNDKQVLDTYKTNNTHIDNIRPVLDFLNSHLGLGLDENSLDPRRSLGRIRDFDDVLKFTKPEDWAQALHDPVYVSKSIYAPYYKKTATRDRSFLQSEKDRLAALVGKNKTISPNKRRDFAVRRNIIQAFLDALALHDSTRKAAAASSSEEEL